MKPEDSLVEGQEQDIQQIVEHVMAEADKRCRARGYRGIDGTINDPALRGVLEVLLETVYAEIDRRLPAPRAAAPSVMKHSMIATMDMSRIVGCTCGWKPAMTDTAPDAAFVMHVAMVESAK